MNRSKVLALAPCFVAVLAASCTSSSAPEPPKVGLDETSPWPKFRADAAQTGRGRFAPTLTGGRLWEFKTGKGIFSSPVIGADGTVFIGSADRNFYAIGADGTLKWKVAAGEIIDSSALLDDRGRVYFGAGDAKLRALDAASGREIWTMQADDPKVNGAFINWFEGNVALGPGGTLYVPNDNFFVYAIDRDTGVVRWRFKTPDQTWSLPAVDAVTKRVFVGNNNVLPLSGQNTFALEADGSPRWAKSTLGSNAASPLLADGRVVMGGFDGYVRAYDADSGDALWEVPTRDHVYASAALLPDRTLVQPSTDGTLYAIEPTTGRVLWTFDTPDPIRGSPAVDTEGNVYFGGGDGRLWVVRPDGTLRWSMRLVTDERNDLNASPALGRDAIVIAGESGQVFSIPYDYCLRPEGKADARCESTPMVKAPAGAEFRFVSAMGATLERVPDLVDANEPITFQLAVRRDGRSVLATLDATSVAVKSEPSMAFDVRVAGDGKFVTLVPRSSMPATLKIDLSARWMEGHDRKGLRLSGGHAAGDVSGGGTFHARPSEPTTLAAAVAKGTAGTTWEVSRLALPTPTLMPSYNQIGFDSLHYLVAMLESGPERGVAWMLGAKLDAENHAVIDPATRALFPLEVVRDQNRLTFLSAETLRVEVMNIVVPFQSFRISTRLDGDAKPQGLAHLAGSTVCATVPFYGQALQLLGLCNPQTDELVVVGGANLTRVAPLAGGSEGASDVVFTRDATGVSATLTGSTVRAADHVVSLALVDAATGRPVVLDYGVDTARALDVAGNVTRVSVPFQGRAVPAKLRGHLLVDTRVLATSAL